MSHCFLQLSDPHLSSLAGVRPTQLFNKRLLGYLSWRRRRRFEHRPEVLDALLEDLRDTAAAEKPECSQILVTGDLTHVGLPSEFRQVSAWLPRLGPPDRIALVPGNHEACVASPWNDTYALWADYMASDAAGGRADIFPSLRVRGPIAFIGLSTACPTPPLMATGRVDAAQLEALPGLLDDCGKRGLFRVLYLHHSPVPGQDKWRKRLVNARAVAGIIEDHGAELVLHGHGHRAHHATLPGRHGDVPVLAVPSASALGQHGADVAAYNHYRVEQLAKGWTVEVRSRRYDRETGLFGAGESVTLELGRG